MKFLCLECDEAMDFAERQLPGDGTLAAVFKCPGCGREMAMLTNPMETQLVSSLGVKIGGRDVPAQPMELVRGSLEGGREDAFEEPAEALSQDVPVAGVTRPAGAGPVVWTPEAVDRLSNVPKFVRGMVKRIYGEWAREQGVAEMTPELMDQARTQLGMEGM